MSPMGDIYKNFEENLEEGDKTWTHKEETPYKLG